MSYIKPVQHKYAVGQRVRCINPDHAMNGREGLIIEHMRYWFPYPGYDVVFDASGNKIVGCQSDLSKRSIVRSAETV